jgi:hypothetical protein
VPPVATPAAAPPRVWYLAAALAAAAVLAAWLLVGEAGLQIDTSFTQFNRERLAEFEARASAAGARRVVLLGSSALKYATRDEDPFAAGVAAAAGEPVAVLRIASNWGSFYDFAPLAGDILRARPDLVVMESEFLAADRPRQRRFLLWIRQLRRNLGLDVPQDVVGVSEAEVQFNYPCWNRKASRGHDLLLRVRSNWVSIRPDGPGPRAARRFAEQLLASGTEVALVGIPRRPDYETEARRTREVALDGAQGRALSGRVRNWQPAPVPAELYCDLTHVQPAGQALISGWLESRIAAALPRARS